MESFIRILQLPETGRRERTQGQSRSPRMLCSKMHPRRQDGEKPSRRLLLAYRARLGGRYGKASPSCSHPHAAQQPSVFLAQAPLRHGTAGAQWTGEGFESGWLKFNPSPSVLSRGPCQPPQCPGDINCPSFSHIRPSPISSQRSAPSHLHRLAALTTWQGTADPLPGRWEGG